MYDIYEYIFRNIRIYKFGGNMKRVLAFILVFVLILSVSVNVYAVSGGRTATCDECGKTMSHYKVSYGAWEGPIDIRRAPNGYMYLFIRDVNSFYHCPDCGSYKTTTHTERMWTDKNM